MMTRRCAAPFDMSCRRLGSPYSRPTTVNLDWRYVPSAHLIISGDEVIDVVLRSMGFDQTFDMVPGALPVSVAADVSAEPIEMIDSPSANDLRQTMPEAHRALIRLSDAGRLEFEPVVQCLERDLVDPSSDSSRSIQHHAGRSEEHT